MILFNLILAGASSASVGLMALAMPRHYTNVFGVAPKVSSTHALRLAGWMALAASLIVAIADWRGGASLVAWIALWPVQALFVSLLLTYVPRLVPAFAGLSALVTVSAWTAFFAATP